MDYRRLDSDTAHPGTCNWILSHKDYRNWILNENGLLCIKEKPGSGKSTLMAYLYKNLQDNLAGEHSVSLTFFFHRRGATLQKTFIGMLRALLCQVYRAFPLARKAICLAFHDRKIFGEARKDWDWQEKELHDLLFSAILNITQRTLIFVDALDEAGEDAQETAEYFYRLNDEIKRCGRPVKICISYRHYPVFATPSSLKICVEEHNNEDILIYVHYRLSSSIHDEKSLKDLEKRVTDKALGIFQWACLTVRIIIA